MTVNELCSLVSQYPFPDGWSEPELFLDRVEWGELTLQLVGLVSHHWDGRTVTGSAAEVGAPPLARAFFELVERICVLEAEPRAGELRLVDSLGRLKSSDASSLFPQSPDPERWRYAKSNGVATAGTWETAAFAARAELAERDRILRSWFGGTAPRVLGVPEGLPQALRADYDFRLLGFNPVESVEGTLQLNVVVGLPRRAGLPRAFGAAAAADGAQAAARALRECLQGLGFLWGEPISSEPPPFSPTPDYHQELYLHPEGIARLKDWADGRHERFGGAKPPRWAEFSYADITPTVLRGRLVVVKAISPELMPLTFGYTPTPRLGPSFPEELRIHPMA